MTHAFSTSARPVGDHIREWRRRRRLSQLDFALEAGISQKHLSFIESGRSSPSREMVLRLAEHLQAPLRERNAMIIAAGFAPVFPERKLDDPALAPALAAIRLILDGHQPYPAIAVDRHWTLVAANTAAERLFGLVTDTSLLKAPVNVLKVSLAPGGLAPHIANLPVWRAHLLERLRQQIAFSGDAQLARLLGQLKLMSPADEPPSPSTATAYAGIAVPLVLRLPTGALSLISTTTVFGTPVDVTLSEIALETFFPADAETAAALQAMARAVVG